MRLIIVESPGRTVVAEIDYTGPVPRPGEYIFRPGLFPGRLAADSVMGVRTVTWGILARSGQGDFVGEPEPYVEIHI